MHSFQTTSGLLWFRYFFKDGGCIILSLPVQKFSAILHQAHFHIAFSTHNWKIVVSFHSEISWATSMNFFYYEL